MSSAWEKWGGAGGGRESWGDKTCGWRARPLTPRCRGVAVPGDQASAAGSAAERGEVGRGGEVHSPGVLCPVT